jgi:2Fe-2S ferredoxin
MPKIICLPQNKTVEAKRGQTLLEALLKAGLPVANSCRADFVCGKCHLQILEGKDNLSPPSKKEKELLTREKCDASERMSCFAKVLGDCTVKARYW